MIINIFLVRACVILQENNQLCREYEKNTKMAEMVKDAESRVVDTIVKKAAKANTPKTED